MRVLHVQKVNGIGGSERHLLSLLPGLRERGLEPSMIVVATAGASEFTDRLEELAIPFDTVPAGPDVNPMLASRLALRLRRLRPNLVHTHLIHADMHGQLAAWITRVPSICSVHSTHGFYTREPYRSASRLAGRVPRVTIAISEYVRQFLQRLRIGAPERIQTVHYGIAATGHPPDEATRAAARQAYGISPDEVAVGVAARLIPHKGHELLFDAFAQASSRGPRVRLLVAGDGILRSELEARARAADADISMLGFVQDIVRFMQACDVLVFPSQPEFGEGFGLAALEALAAGRPVIATDAASLPEIVTHRETGILVPPGESGPLADAIAELAVDSALRERLSEAAALRAADRFSLAAMVDGTVAVYERALRHPPHP